MCKYDCHALWEVAWTNGFVTAASSTGHNVEHVMHQTIGGSICSAVSRLKIWSHALTKGLEQLELYEADWAQKQLATGSSIKRASI